MYEVQGNLALQKKKPAGRRQQAGLFNRRVIKMKRVSVLDTPDADQIMQARVSKIRRQLLHKRIGLLFSTVALVFLIAGIFGLIVYRQARILESNFETVSLERELARKQQESSQIQEWLAEHTNLDQIRHQAMTRLGLQDPARSQLRTVYVPQTDQVIFNNQVESGQEQDAYLSEVATKIEAYFKSIKME